MTKNQKIIFLSFLFLMVFVSFEANAEVFDEMAKRTGKFAEGFRRFAMILSCFGIIMFTFLAICGKINFKHLGYIFICLFFVSGVGAMIVYIKGGNTELVYNFKDTYHQSINAKGYLPTHNSGI